VLNDIALGDAVRLVVPVTDVPVPLKLTLSFDPLLRQNVSVPLYACAAAGLNVTDATKLLRPARTIGNAAPEYTNAPDDTDPLTMVIELLLELVIVTDIGALVVPTAWLGKLSELALDVNPGGIANAAMPHMNMSATIAAAPNTFSLVFC
jgi:hypothetical protein